MTRSILQRYILLKNALSYGKKLIMFSGITSFYELDTSDFSFLCIGSHHYIEIHARPHDWIVFPPAHFTGVTLLGIRSPKRIEREFSNQKICSVPVSTLHYHSYLETKLRIGKEVKDNFPFRSSEKREPGV